MSNLSVFKSNDGIEVIIDQQTGESFCSVSGYARMSGKDKGTISRRLKTVAVNGVKTDEIQTVTGLKTVALIDASLVCEWLIQDAPGKGQQLISHLHNGGTLSNFSFVSVIEPIEKKSSNREKDVVKALLTGRSHLVQTEVETPLGNIDILTSKYLIEVKNWKSFKCALGQLLAYGFYFPNHNLLAVLFGKGLRENNCSIVEQLFSRYGIEMYCVHDIPTYMGFGVRYL